VSHHAARPWHFLAHRVLANEYVELADRLVVSPKVEQRHAQVEQRHQGFRTLRDVANSFTLLLQSAKPVVAMETSDAVTKRKMSIEVKATIQK
jgi:hypothetical protein